MTLSFRDRLIVAMKLRPTLLCGAVLALSTCLAAEAQAAAAERVPTPRARSQPGPAPAEAYRELEVLYSGTARVFDWAPADASGAALVRTFENPYTARLRVRLPIDAARASGRVVLEVLTEQDGQERAPVWELAGEGLRQAGDIWVGASLQGRLPGLSWPDPAAPDCLTRNGALPLLPDMLAQAGMLLRSSSKENPLSQLAVSRVVATAHGSAATRLALYHQLAQERLRVGAGDPVFDAYVFADPGELPDTVCLRSLPAGDPRQELTAVDVPLLVLRDPARLPPSLVGTALADLPPPPPPPVRGRRPPVPPATPAPASDAAPVPPIVPLAPGLYLLGHAGLGWTPGQACTLAPVGPQAAAAALWKALDDAMLRGIPLPAVTPADYGACRP